MKSLRHALLGLCLLWSATAWAAENVLLIQMQADGSFRVWHSEGESHLSDDEILELEVTARPAGGAVVQSAAGPVRAFLVDENAVIIRLLAAQKDTALLVDRDSCGHLRLWHADGTTRFDNDQLVDIVMSALPEGGKRITIGSYYVKAYLTRLGVTAALWEARRK